MKTYAIVTAMALFAGMIGPSYALDGAVGLRAPNPATLVGCDVKNDEDKQGMCARKCDDEYISGKMHYGADIAKVTEEKQACDVKCGCPQNSK
jgi:hypothetical protein